MKEPKVFISYSWTNQMHQERVKHWADRLIADGVEVVLDIYDLKEGHDIYRFMESMVTDPAVTHVLVMCDKEYAEKANAGKAGVGTESQIISSEIYGQVKQSKFIPIVCELDDEREPILPVLMKSRMWIDLSSLESENKNWERLLRHLYGKPQHEKPKKGKAPVFIKSDIPLPTSEAFSKFNLLKRAVLEDKKGLKHYRRDFIDACISYADNLRVRERPKVEDMGEKILEDCGKLKAVRNHLCDWLLLESELSDKVDFSESLMDVLEKLRDLKSRPPEINSWDDSWSEAHAVFVYETFLYIVAALLKSGAYGTLNEIYTSHYLVRSPVNQGEEKFERFSCFFGHSEALQSVLAPEGKRLYAPAAELISKQADRKDLPFSDIWQAELLTFLMSFITPETYWRPTTLLYSSYYSYPFFVRAAQHRNFVKLAEITGINNADILREKARQGYDRFNANDHDRFIYSQSFWHYMNMDKLDSLK